MAKRSRNWSDGLSKRLKNKSFAREYIIACLDEGLSIQLALGDVIRAHGVKEFAAKVKLAPSNVQRAINPKHNPTQETLEKLLKPWGLRLTVAALPSKKAVA